MQPLPGVPVAMGPSRSLIRFIAVPLAAVALVASLGACTIKEERTVQQPAPATVVATPAPGTVVYTDPAPTTSTTTVYTR